MKIGVPWLFKAGLGSRNKIKIELNSSFYSTGYIHSLYYVLHTFLLKSVLKYLTIFQIQILSDQKPT